MLRAQSDEVQVGVVIRDEKGRVVNGLKLEDFSVLDDGKKQQLSGFTTLNRALRSNPVSGSSTPSSAPSPEAAHPSARQRFVAMFFDDYHTKDGDIRHVQIAAEEFLRNSLTADDRIGLFTASGSLQVDFTSDSSRALDALPRLKSRWKSFDNTSCPRITAHDGYLIDQNLDPEAYRTAYQLAVQCNCNDMANFDPTCTRQQEDVVRALARQVWAPTRAISAETLGALSAVINHLGGLPGDRVLLMASSGFFAGTLQNSVDQLVSDALRRGVVINAIDAKGLYPDYQDPGERFQGDSCSLCPASMARLRHEYESFGSDLVFSASPMAALVMGTGGRFVHDRNDITEGYSSLAAAPETEYILGFTPAKLGSSASFHKLKVEVAVAGKVEIESRPGYFPPQKESSHLGEEQKMDAEVRGTAERSDFPLDLSQQDRVASNGSHELTVEMRVGIQNLPFKRQKDRHLESLTFVAALFDPTGNLIAGEEAQAALALKPESFEGFLKNGLSVVTSLKAPKGVYSLRVVVQESMRGKMSAATKSVTLQ